MLVRDEKPVSRLIFPNTSSGGRLIKFVQELERKAGRGESVGA
jgi:hypothetical protein